MRFIRSLLIKRKLKIKRDFLKRFLLIDKKSRKTREKKRKMHTKKGVVSQNPKGS